ncbi:MAG: LysM peptidoglycan-binding domain-containing protein [Anaerolineae bacterium]
MYNTFRLLLISLCLILSSGIGIQASSSVVAQSAVVANSPVVPDVAVLPFLRGGDVWLAEVTGRNQWQMTEGGQAWAPALSPDEAHLAYVIKPTGAESTELWLADLRAGSRQRIDVGPPPWGTPSWAPDGQMVAWVRGQSLVISDLGGATRILVDNLSVRDMERPEAVWSHNGSQILCSFVVDGQRSLWTVPVAGGPWGLQAPLSADGSAVVAVSAASQRMVVWQPGALRLLPVPGNQDPTARSLPLDAIPAAVTQMAWAPDGARLALLDYAGSIWVSRLDEWAPQAVPLGGLQASRMAWLLDGRLVFWVSGADPRDEAVHVVESVASGGVRRLSPALAALSLPVVDPPTAGASAVDVGYDWYRYQGEWDSGAMAHSNCGPTSVSMAIQFARNNQWVSIGDIRSYIGGTSWTYVGMLQDALNHWQVPNRRLGSMQEIHDAVAVRGSIVLVHLWMNWINPGPDYLQPNSSPAGAKGRFYAYNQSHWVVLKGISADGEWAICHDPNVWDGNGIYWYAGGIPKGKDRSYHYTEIANAIHAYGYEAIEVFAQGSVPATTMPTRTATATATRTPTVSGAGVWYTVARGDTLGRIAQRYQVSVAAIVAANRIVNPNLLVVGQRLWIPSGSAPTPTATRTPTRAATSMPTPAATSGPTATPGNGFWYTVQRGDTLAVIGARYGVSVWTIATANRLDNPNLLAIGQRLWISTGSGPVATPSTVPTATSKPGATPTPGGGRWYTVQRGDTLSVIAARFDVTTWAIASANGLWNPNLIWIGQRLWIPGAAG